MKKIVWILALIWGVGLNVYPQDWLPPELAEMESRFLEIRAQVVTLDDYSPRNFPNFKELERINQLVERLDFNKRKFKLLIEAYNLLEDRILPSFLKLSGERPALTNRIATRVGEYTGEEEKSILALQKDINSIALLIERLEKEIEIERLLSRTKEATKEIAMREGADERTLKISERIQYLEESLTDYRQELKVEEGKLEGLEDDKGKSEDKIREKLRQAEELKKTGRSSPNRVERLISLTFAQVREIRVNGLEIPRLNTIKTFIYLTRTKIETLKDEIKRTEKEIAFQEGRQRKKLQETIIKGVVVIFVALFVVIGLIKIARKVSRKVMKRIEASDHIDPHRKQRFQTLSSITLSFVKIVLWVMGVLWVLGELDIDYTPFLVAAGGVSLAIGFGAQSLVKDVVSGFFILMEEQLALGDVVEIDGKTGTVETISLRTIKFRSLDGTLHIVPNGNVSRVSNQTYQWSRAVITVGVSYDADARNVLSILQDICRQMYGDPAWKPKLVDEPFPQGIISLGDSAVTFRILAKTAPGEQWPVEREFKIRIKETFDKQGVEIPYNFVNIVDRTEKEK